MGNNGNVIRAAVFASGSGSNAENILRFAQACPDELLVSVLICNKENAGVIERAEQCNVPCVVMPVERENYASFKEARLAQEKDVLAVLEKLNVEWVFLAGYMQIISPAFLSCFEDKVLGVNRVVNIHPSLLPAFPGKDGYGDAWEAGVDVSGVTLHFVDEGVDTGPIIAQKKFKRLEKDTLSDFRARGMALEYEIYTEFLTGLIAKENKKWAQQ